MENAIMVSTISCPLTTIRTLFQRSPYLMPILILYYITIPCQRCVQDVSLEVLSSDGMYKVLQFSRSCPTVSILPILQHRLIYFMARPLFV